MRFIKVWLSEVQANEILKLIFRRRGEIKNIPPHTEEKVQTRREDRILSKSAHRIETALNKSVTEEVDRDAEEVVSDERQRQEIQLDSNTDD